MHKSAGVLFFLAGAIILMGIITAEIFYPAPYSTAQDYISTLGSSPPPHSVIYQPSAAIFDNSLKLAGLLILIGSYFLYKKTGSKLVVSLALMGIGTIGVGVFPAFHKHLHPIAALLSLGGGGVAAIATTKLTKPPFSYLAIVLGIISLFFLIIGLGLPQLIVPILGKGGVERFVAYPNVMWLMGLGGYLMGYTTSKKSQ